MEERYIVSGIIQDGDRIILGKKIIDKPPYPNLWHTPGGGVKDFGKASYFYALGDFDNEYFHEELRREIREELGVEIKNINCIIPKFRQLPREDVTENIKGELAHYYFLEYLCDYSEGELKAGDDLAEAKWFYKKELNKLNLTPPSEEMYNELGWLKN